MKRSLWWVVLLLGVVACGQDPGEGATGEVDRDARDPVAGAPAAPAGLEASLEQPLREGLVLDLPAQLRRDRTYTHDDGSERRRIVLERLGTDAASAFASMERAFTDAGFKAGEVKAGEEGNARMRFRKDSYGIVMVSIRPDWGSDDDAEGDGDADADAGAGDPPAGNIVIIDFRPDPAAAQ